MKTEKERTVNRTPRELSVYVTSCRRLAVIAAALLLVTALMAVAGLIPAVIATIAGALLTGVALGFGIAAIAIRAVDRGALS